MHIDKSIHHFYIGPHKTSETKVLQRSEELVNI